MSIEKEASCGNNPRASGVGVQSERAILQRLAVAALLRAKLRRITLSSVALGLALGIVHQCATGAAIIEHTSSIRNHQHAQCAQ
jgi:hypothetical protein